jgi:23S rRNA pseudouridine1911/1915/1917 synthase
VNGAVGARRSLPVPDGLDGLRLDQAVSRLFGLSRTAAAALVEAGDALVDGVPRPKSDKVSGGSWLEVTLPAPPAAAPADDRPVPGLKIVFSDEHIVVVDKPVGVAAHPSPGWTGPTVTGGLAAMGQTIATGGAAER